MPRIAQGELAPPLDRAQDNHIWSTGGIPEAVKCARRLGGFALKIEVECQGVDQALQACGAGADVVMLDNLSPADFRRAAAAVKAQCPHVLIEGSGGIDLANAAEYMCPAADVLSSGSLSQGVPCVDFSLKVVHGPSS